MGLQRELAVMAMNATPLPGKTNFLEEVGIATPVPRIRGSIGAVAREPFLAFDNKRLFDLLVAFTIADFPDGAGCSDYFNPHSPWYNVFYGAYGVRSYKRDGNPWGFRSDGRPDVEEMLEIPRLDYNFLTAGELGCPASRMCFEVREVTTGRQGAWHSADVACVIPSGLHRTEDADAPDLSYYAVFGMPEEDYLAGGRESYEPVAMRGRMYWRPVADRLTLVWGGLCPDTPEGQSLMHGIIDAMTPVYTGG
ncbi:hypothetical protein HUA75_32735 [Myxococcus sp. CA040A]|uniref:Uncharacterized protein n=2 Tax=Myxococcaceae TaxID=31 RepID=A0A540WV13_9BACT|nr:hypothetical protein [Myxococcus sp. CA040A]NTX56606.1 hypothetical protein [Myxococcus sp. CA039A]TQF12865.1 hypothetical protein FJV41_26920 [Myxococcus llanfairpwllgwyngyllgogerychwyrndrobwllllantysiliogogogochensis]